MERLNESLLAGKRRHGEAGGSLTPKAGEPARSKHSNRFIVPDLPHASSAFLYAAFAALAGPTLVMIARESWTDEQSQQGPIVLAIGAWLLWRRWGAMRAAGVPGSLALSISGYAVSAMAYVGGRISSLYIVEAYALYGFGVCAVYALVGWRGVLAGLFPLIFLGFAAPVPFAVGWPITVSLRLAISQFCVEFLRVLHVDAARDGLTIYLSSYRIDIAQACSGMNSLLALTALGLCYVHIRRDPPLSYFLILFPLIVLFGVVANFARVVLLALMTLGLGDAVAQGVLHETLGFATFAIALLLTFTADTALARIWFRGGPKRIA